MQIYDVRGKAFWDYDGTPLKGGLWPHVVDYRNWTEFGVIELDREYLRIKLTEKGRVIMRQHLDTHPKTD